ncbi:unnamed protein product [Angiostrongylus costaricensis]|uniref:TOG domain-containing protein n=1 Tax=Angiostrongylus costaricensis TaxID=334426 RepID=A0A0R3PVG0_ANGCS|nr:unnamed protein product [Angiostrongylus costaricensis]
MDEWILLDEVDVIALWPKEQQKNVESSKWQERKEALEVLAQLIEKHPRLSTVSMTIYGEVMDNLKKILAHDSNINVVAVALRVLGGLARGLRNQFSCFVSMVWSVMLEKAKDKKPAVQSALGIALDAVSDSCGSDRITKDLCEHLLKPNPQSKQCLCSFLFRYFIRQNELSMEFAKAVLPIVVKLVSDSSPSVREAACSSLGSARRLLGKGLDVFLNPLISEKTKLDKQYATMEFSVLYCYVYQVASKKWQERKEAFDSILSIMESAPRVAISPQLQQIMTTILKVMDKDVNINVASTCAKSMTKLALSMRTDFAVMVMAVVFDKLKEKKAVLRSELVELCDAAATTTPLECYTEAVCDGLAKSNPQSRAQTALFLSRLLSRHNSSTFPIEAIKQIMPGILKCSSDADGEVREAAFRVMAAILRCVGMPASKRFLCTLILFEKIRAEFGDKAAPEILRLRVSITKNPKVRWPVVLDVTRL